MHQIVISEVHTLTQRSRSNGIEEDQDDLGKRCLETNTEELTSIILPLILCEDTSHFGIVVLKLLLLHLWQQSLRLQRKLPYIHKSLNLRE